MAPVHSASSQSPARSQSPPQSSQSPARSQSPPQSSQSPARSQSPPQSSQSPARSQTPLQSSPGASNKRPAQQRPAAGETRAQKQRRVESPPQDSSSDGEEEGSSDEEEEEVMRVRNRRGEGADREYQLAWRDGSLVWKKASELKSCPILVALFDRYIDKYPSKEISYAQFTARDVPSIGLMSDNEYDDCAVHSVEMAFELFGLVEEAGCLRKLGADFIAKLKAEGGTSIKDRAAVSAPSTRMRGLKLKDLARFLVQEVPKVGWSINMKDFNKKNWFAGKGAGPGAIADIAVSGKLPRGVFLVHAYKPSGRGHCAALRYVNDELVIREEGKADGIMNQKWITNIRFVRQLCLRRLDR